ncbi:MAG: protein phosphatase 2C domain-containing protein [archaeon]|nr:protein phosphatase 2C domain-containing protein [archaeon]
MSTNYNSNQDNDKPKSITKENIIKEETENKIKEEERTLTNINLKGKKFKINPNAANLAPIKDVKTTQIKDDFSKGFQRQSTFQQNQNLKALKDKSPINKDFKKTKTILRPNNYLYNFSDKDLPEILSPLCGEYSGFHKAMHSSKSIGKIFSYGVNCYKGIYRDYNEDRVCIFFNIAKPKGSHNTNWPSTLSIFGIFDGHGGKKCSEFLRDNLHIYLIQNKNFPKNIETAIKEAFHSLDEDFLKMEGMDKDKNLNDNSGSCANVCIIAENICYIANVGDSRSFLSQKKGTIIKQLSTDHKPILKEESQRIKQNGGQIYKSGPNQSIYRISPGNIAISRAFGNATCKIEHLGGKPGVIISTPQITKINLDEVEENDYIFMGCDGIYDKMTNEDINKAIWESLNCKYTITSNIHRQSSLCVDLILKSVMHRKGTDNLTAILIGLKGLNDEYQKKLITSKD